MGISNKYYLSSGLIVALCLTLAACGGSSPSPTRPITMPTAPPPAPPPPTGESPSDFETAEYNADWSLSAINASDAYARGFTGEGAIIGIVDFNFELDNSDVDWHSASRDKDQRWITMYEAFLGVETTNSNHGQWVSSIAAARKDNFASHGVAFDSRVLAVDFFSGVSMHTEVSDGVTLFVSDPWGFVVQNGARVVNKSLGFDEEDFVQNPPARNGNEHYVITNSARVVELGGLLVASAGNDGDPDPMVSNIETLDIINQNNLWASGGFYLVAGSLNENGTISDFSDRAGVLQDFYLVAPGEDVAVSSFEFSPFGIGSGTSFASPHIVGAAALLFGQWPQLEAFEVADILLTTATDLGAPGVDAIYGHGLLNLDEATKPTGQTTVAVKGAVVPVSVGDSMMVLGSAFGDASPQNLSAVMILDKYDRDFYIDARSSVLTAPTDLNFSGILDLRRSQTRSNWRVNSGMRANMVMQNSSFSRDAHRDTLSDLEKTAQKQELRSWYISGSMNKNSQWVMGQGRGLNSVLDMVDKGSVTDHDLFLAGHEKNLVGSIDNIFMAGGMALGSRDSFSIGLMTGDSKGQGHNALAVLQDDLNRYGIETRLTHLFDGGHISMGLGALMEQKSVLGSRSNAGFALADHTVTGTLSLNGAVALGEKWTLSGQAMGGMSNVTTNQISLFSGFNRFLSTQWSARITTHGLFTKGDRFGFNISQPLRVENANILVSTATHFDLSTDAPVFALQQITLTPTGREISLEAGYSLQKGPWTMSANLIRRFDTGHRASLNDIAVLLQSSKKF